MVRDKLYSIDNKTKSKSINVEDTLYDAIRELSMTKYDAKVSEIINVAIEEYNSPNFHGKRPSSSVTYRNLMLRQKNIEKLNQFYEQTGISFTRLVNAAIKEFLEKEESN